MNTLSRTLSLFSILCAPYILHAGDSLTVKTISLDLANDIAIESIRTCRKMGYQVSAVVVDRNGLVQTALRDDLASRFTLQIAEEKANSVILSGSNSGEFRRSRADIRPELNHMDGIIIMQGALPIEIAGSRIGAIGVSGAPGGDKDEACAQQALD
ncbi:MAG: heme-binding protein, partial [Gammaproteobacteria bacterium]|nr:heme-binding protein [Gammaproteobacteria bacterium]